MSRPFYVDMIDDMTSDEFKEFQKTMKSLNDVEKKEFLKNSYKDFIKKEWNWTMEELNDWIEKIFQK